MVRSYNHYLFEESNANETKERTSVGERLGQSDVAGRMKCSSRNLTLEFAGNRTGLQGLGVGWILGGVSVYNCAEVYK